VANGPGILKFFNANLLSLGSSRYTLRLRLFAFVKRRSFINRLSCTCSATPGPIAVAAVEVLEKQMSLSNSLGLLGRKVGMMRLFTDDGDAVPVTVVDVSNNRVTQVKTQENDGYVPCRSRSVRAKLRA
jgi:hypothetical protein